VGVDDPIENKWTEIKDNPDKVRLFEELFGKHISTTKDKEETRSLDAAKRHQATAVKYYNEALDEQAAAAKAHQAAIDKTYQTYQGVEKANDEVEKIKLNIAAEMPRPLPSTEGFEDQADVQQQLQTVKATQTKHEAEVRALQDLLARNEAAKQDEQAKEQREKEQQ